MRPCTPGGIHHRRSGWPFRLVLPVRQPQRGRAALARPSRPGGRRLACLRKPKAPRAPTAGGSSTDELAWAACSLAIRQNSPGEEVRIPFRALQRAALGLRRRKRERPPSNQRPWPAGFSAAAARHGALRVPEAPIEAPSPSLRLAASAGNPLANAVSKREPDGERRHEIKYQGTHGYRPGNDHQILSALNNGKM